MIVFLFSLIGSIGVSEYPSKIKSIDPPQVHDGGTQTFNDDQSAVNWLTSIMLLDDSAARSFVNKIKWENNARSSFLRFSMASHPTLSSQRYASRSFSIISAHKNGNSFVIRGCWTRINVGLTPPYSQYTHGSRSRIDYKLFNSEELYNLNELLRDKLKNHVNGLISYF